MIVQRTHSTPAFTIMELLVAITVTTLMLLLINQIFFQTSRAISQGVALSNTMGDSRTASEQFARDAQDMTGPSNLTGKGFLVIVQRIVGDWDGDGVLEPDHPDEPEGVAMPSVTYGGGETTELLRSDQLVFIKRRDTADPTLDRPLTPASKNTFSNATANSAEHIRIWYGHVLKTLPDGSAPEFPLGHEKPPHPNRLGTDWILGRQALFLGYDTDDIDDIDIEDIILAEGEAGYNSPVKGYGVLGSDGYPRPVYTTSNLALYMGLTDVTNRPLQYILDTFEKLYRDPDKYAEKAYDYTYAQYRLHANPVPKYAYSPSNTSIDSYERAFAAWQIAQTHPVFMNHCSDFQVSFAGDYDSDVGIDKDVNGNIIWYDHFDAPPSEGFNKALDGPVYDTNPIDLQGIALNHADAAFVFRHDMGGTNPTNWPYLIRIRYRLHDARGKLQDADGQSGNRFEQIISVTR